MPIPHVYDILMSWGHL